MMLLGVDPGLGGAVVLLDAHQRPVAWSRMPTLVHGRSTKRIDAASLMGFLRAYAADIRHAYVEDVHAMPGQGVSSMFAFGRACGAVDGVLAALGIPTTYVTPQRWKKAAGLIGTDKDAARSRAIQLWPQWRALSQKGEGQALADAALVAAFGA
jgi:crossover junction endodeoxyribonuclease RuvC